MGPGLVESLRRQASRCEQIPLYRERFRETGVSAADLRSEADLPRFPLLTRADLTRAFTEHPGHGGFATGSVLRIHHTPSPGLGLMPVFLTATDVARQRRATGALLRDAGLSRDDTVQIGFGYHLFPTGLIFQDGVEEVGARVVNFGPGQSEQHAACISRLGVTALACNPSFALKVASEGARAVRLLITGGEPMASVRGRRQQVSAAYDGALVVDTYGTGELGIVAMECRHQQGLHVDVETAWIEVLDPETGAPVADGERGELVVTLLHREAMPLFRFRTGDLGIMVDRPCPCGRSRTMPEGVLGRVDNMVKVKGVKLYPREVERVLAAVPGLAGARYQVVVRNRAGVDHLLLRVASELNEEAVRRLSERFQATLHMALNAVESLSGEPGELVLDERGL